jgi:hypothetical protein
MKITAPQHLPRLALTMLLAIGSAGAVVATTAPQPAQAATRYGGAYHRYYRYSYGGGGWHRGGVYFAPRAGWYGSVGYVGVAAPVYGYPSYAYGPGYYAPYYPAPYYPAPYYPAYYPAPVYGYGPHVSLGFFFGGRGGGFHHR